MPATKASVKVTIQVNEDGTLVVKASSIETGNEMEANYYDGTLI